MSIDALVKQVDQVLDRAHALFGQPGPAAGLADRHSGVSLAGAAELVARAHQRMSGLSGVLPATYHTFAADAGAGLGSVSNADNRLGTQIHDAVQADWTGRAGSGSVVNGAATDIATLAPVSRTPAGQRALIATLRARVAQQQKIVNARKAQECCWPPRFGRCCMRAAAAAGAGCRWVEALCRAEDSVAGVPRCRPCPVRLAWVILVGSDHVTHMPASSIGVGPAT
ncbi:hypothetical protein [Mycobacterium sp. M23085]|uniref:hypothetical protein n=1 Tax=Mycobacterium sp. M23085 TaxID=3378087 RepID=UPI0038783B55